MGDITAARTLTAPTSWQVRAFEVAVETVRAEKALADKPDAAPAPSAS